MLMRTQPLTLRLRIATRAVAALAAIGLVGVGASTPAQADNVPLAERQFIVHVQQIRALDETGPVNFGLSDQIYAGFQTSFVGGQTHLQTAMFGDFDAGETRTARLDQSCLMPILPLVNNGLTFLLSGLEQDTWGCTVNGFNAPFDIRARLFEADFDIPSCGIPCTFDPDPLPGPGIELRRIADDDDPIGETVLSFSRTGLAGDLTVPGASRDYTVNHHGSGGHYQVTYRVTRIR